MRTSIFVLLVCACGPAPKAVEATPSTPALSAKPKAWAIDFSWPAADTPVDHYDLVQYLNREWESVPVTTVSIPGAATSYTLDLPGALGFGEGFKFKLTAVTKDGKSSEPSAAVAVKTCSALICSGRKTHAVTGALGLGITAAVYVGGNFVIAGRSNTILLSVDGGETFIEKSVPFQTQSLAVRGNTVVAATDLGLYTSTDKGANWASTSASGIGQVTTDDSRFVAFGVGVTQFSGDGITWTQTVGGAGLPGAIPGTVVFGNQKYIAPGLSVGEEKNIYVSSDALTWTLSKTMSANYTQIVFQAGVFVAVNGGAVYTSVDGATWSGTSVTADARSGFAVNGLFVVIKQVVRNQVSQPEQSGFYYSSDKGVTWKEDLAGYFESFLIYGGNKYLCAYGNGDVYTYDAL